MELTTMSSEEFALQFTDKNQQTNPGVTSTNPSGANPSVSNPIIGNKSSEEMANTGTNPEPAEDDPLKVAPKSGRPVKEKIDETFRTGLDKLFKSNKLSPFSNDTPAGYAIPETWEDVEEVLEENRRSWIENAKNEDKQSLIAEIIGSKSPAWQFLLQNSEMYRSPEEMQPLINAVNIQEQYAALNADIPEHQEIIIRSALQLQGLPAEMIENDIIDLKERGKIAERAVGLKPALDKYNANVTHDIIQRKQIEEQKDQRFWNEYYGVLQNDLYKAKDIDGIKLKPEHRDLIASTLLPDNKIGGLPIYSLIDEMVAQGNIKVLSKIALLAYDEKLFDTYFTSANKEKLSTGLRKTLRQSSGFSSSETNEDTSPPVATIKKKYGYFG